MTSRLPPANEIDTPEHLFEQVYLPFFIEHRPTRIEHP
jgi:hypothetical protein